MLDINYILENQERVRKAIQNKKASVDLDKLLELSLKRRTILQEIEQLKRLRNEQTARVKNAGKPDAAMIAEGKRLKEVIAGKEPELTLVEVEFTALLHKVPNVYSDDTPIGGGEEENKVIRSHGVIPKFDFVPKEHWQLGEDLDVIDIPRAVKVSGARFNYLKGDLALLQYALVQYTYSVLTDEKTIAKVIKQAKLKVASKPFIPIVPPVIVKTETLERMARLEPREERYHIEGDDLYLVGSAEHSLGAMHMDETVEESRLPLRYVALSTAFRREAGSYGKDLKGIIRVHQFDKLEMESFTTSDNAVAEQDLIVALQEHLVQGLNIPYRVVAICTGDMGGPDFRQIDIECWMPGQNKYRETHTSDLMTDFQSRRLNTKIKKTNGTSEFAHMNDATAFAIGRALVAIMENYQQADGSIVIPKALQPYMFGRKQIE